MISFTCGRCAKPYHLDDSLAGKKARCKACGNEFRIPDASAAVADPKASAPAFDPYGLAEPAPSADPFGNPGGREPFPRVDADEDDLFAPPRTQVLRDKPKSRKAQSTESAAWIGKLTLAGLGLIVLASVIGLASPQAGAVAFILPGLLAVGMMMAGGLWSMIVPFQEGAVQGLMWLFVPFYPLYYAISRWADMRRPILCYLGGAVLLVGTIGLFIAVVGSQEPGRPRAVDHVNPGGAAEGGPAFDAGPDEGDGEGMGEGQGDRAHVGDDVGRAMPPARRPIDRPAATAEDVPDLVADLKVADGQRRRSAANELAKVAPDEAHRAEVVAALIALFADSDQFVRLDVAKALRVWGTAEQVDTWIGLLDDEAFVVRWEALAALGDLKDPRGAEAVAGRLWVDKIKANESLLAMGPAAEPAVLDVMSNPEWSVRMDACKILGEIGTEASRSKLKKAARDSNGLVRMAAAEALRSIGRGR